MSSDKWSEIGQEFGASGFPRGLRKESPDNRREPSLVLEFQEVWKKHPIEKQLKMGKHKGELEPLVIAAFTAAIISVLSFHTWQFG